MPLFFYPIVFEPCNRKIKKILAMKTSIILIVLILFNTTALVSKPLSQLVANIDPWLLIGIEILLLVGYYANNLVKDIGKISKIDFSNLNVFVVNGNSKE